MPEEKTALSASQVDDALRQLPGWRRDGVFLEKTFVFASYREINRFLPYLAQAIVTQNHHPDLSFDSGARALSIRMTTHSHGGITQADINLARALEAWDS